MSYFGNGKQTCRPIGSLGIPIRCSCISVDLYSQKAAFSLHFPSFTKFKKNSHLPATLKKKQHPKPDTTTEKKKKTINLPLLKQHPKHQPLKKTAHTFPPYPKRTSTPQGTFAAWRLSFQALRHKRNDICEEVRCEERYQSL